MKKILFRILLISVPIFFDSTTDYAQVLDMGSVLNFAAYSGKGAVTNSGTSSYSKHVGTDFGVISGFTWPTTMTGTVENENALTEQAKIDLLNIYIHLNDIAVTNISHPAAFGGETVTPGIYSIAGAGSLAGTVILDAQGNNNAAFIMKFEGAFTVAVGASVVLINGARSSNVFWIAEGAISVGTSVTMKGTLFAHPGAVSFGSGGSIDGRLLTTEGAITFGPGEALVPTTMSTIPITCVTVCDNSILGSAAKFALFASDGATSNAGASGFIGDIGSNAGAVTGFETSIKVGLMHNANSTTAQAKIDLKKAYDQLILVPATHTAHLAAFGSGETLTHGVYTIAGAGSLAGNLTLDGEGDPNALFIFRFAGAFNTAAQSKVMLINKARRCNIFWIAEGAIGMGAFTFMKGNLIAHDAANSMAANGNLEGRMYSTLGAVSFSTGVAYITYSLCDVMGPLAVKLDAFSANCINDHIQVKWQTQTEQNNKYFTVEKSTDASHWNVMETINAAGNSSVPHSYNVTDKNSAQESILYYRLHHIGNNGNNEYSKVIMIKACTNRNEDVIIYPALTNGRFNMSFTGNTALIISNQIFNEQGIVQYKSNGFQSKFDISNKPTGVYFIRVQLKNSSITKKFVLVN